MENNILTPAGTPEQMFSLMLLERVEALEAQKSDTDKVIAELQARLSRLEAVSYDASTNEFSDGSIIDWFVHEPVETAYLLSDRHDPCPASGTHMDAWVCWPQQDICRPREDVRIYMQVRRYFRDDHRHFITVPRATRVRDLLRAIYDFYDTPVTRQDLADRDPDEDCYITEALDKLAAGGTVTWMDLIGSRETFGKVEEGQRRHRFMCSGCVRFEGIRDDQGKLVLLLGS